MSNFTVFKEAIRRQMSKMSHGRLYRTKASKPGMWEVYLKSFPPGTNELYRERTEHDCQCCKQFIRAAGNMVSIIDNKPVSIWDIEIEGFYQEVADAMANYVKSFKIENKFLHCENNLGTNFNHQQLEDESVITWEHFHFILENIHVKKGDDIGTELSKSLSTKNVFARGVTEIPVDIIETVIELIEQGSIYRGQEHTSVLNKFIVLKKEYIKPRSGSDNCFFWANCHKPGSRIRNSVIGTLLIDLSDGMDLNSAVTLFEKKVAPENYKRPTALVTKSMILRAENKAKELGILPALKRRFAITEDVSVNNVLFADRTTANNMKDGQDSHFAEMVNEIPENIPNLDKVNEVDIDSFLTLMLPKLSSIELLLENKHIPNMMSLVAPIDPAARNILQWDNNFSWTYNGEVTDSIKQRVKAAGGNVSGILRASLSWFNKDDLDIHIIEPNGNQIYYGNAISRTSGNLDVDMNVRNCVRNAVENIVWTDPKRMLEGGYRIVINNYTKRESDLPGFEVELECAGTVETFHYPKTVKSSEDVFVVEFNFSHANGIEIKKSISRSSAQQEEWSLITKRFHKVSMVMNSPNHWDKNKVGNKHIFFILDQCNNPDRARGFYNEFLRNDLTEHRKVFEILGSKMKAEHSDDQLSGLGFSSTKRNSVYCRVTGAFNRVIKLTF